MSWPTESLRVHMLRNKRVTSSPLERKVLPALKPLLGDTGQVRLPACTALAGVGRERRMYRVRGLLAPNGACLFSASKLGHRV